MNGLQRVFATIALVGLHTAWAGPPVEELAKAVSIDDVRTVRRLVEQRAIDPDALDEKGDTVLIAAIRNDADRVAEYLIADRKVDVDATNVSKETAMMIAAFRNRKDLVERLIDRGAQVNRPGWTALHYAASVGNVDIVKLLLENYAYIDAESPNKTTPLMMAARGDHGDVVRLLVDEGADPTPVNERDLDAAAFARRVGDNDLSQWLNERAAAWRAKYGRASNRPNQP